MSSEIELLAVMTLEESERVYCQSPGCTKTVWKRIHIVRTREGISFYGSVCFDKLIGKANPPQPSYGDWGDRVLTPEERTQLLHNTESFLQQMRVQFESENSVPAPPPQPFPSSPPKNPAPSTGYGGRRHLYCLQCDRQFHSQDRYCTTCQSGANVFTWTS